MKTLQRGDRSTMFAPLARSPTGLVMYSESTLATRLESAPPAAARRVLAYCRVFSGAQTPGQHNQRRVLDEFYIARALAEGEFAEEGGGGLDFRRRRQLDAAPEEDASHVVGPSNQA